jgi:hypothetical protein
MKIDPTEVAVCEIGIEERNGSLRDEASSFARRFQEH